MHSVIGSNVAPFKSPGDWNHQKASKQTKQTFIPELCVNSKQTTNLRNSIGRDGKPDGNL